MATIDGAIIEMIYFFFTIFLIVIIMMLSLKIISKFFKAVFLTGYNKKNEK